MSKPLPCLGNVAGESPSVIRFCGHGSAEFRMAARTRSRDSDSAASGNPTIVKPGRPGARSASTSTTVPCTPAKATDQARASAIKTLRADDRRPSDPTAAATPKRRRSEPRCSGRSARHPTRRVDRRATEAQAAATGAAFVGVTASSGVPKPTPRRVLTSHITSTSPSSATMSTSPSRQRQLRASTVRPAATRWAAATISP